MTASGGLDVAAATQAERLRLARSVLDRAAITGKITRAGRSTPNSDERSVPGAGVVAVDPALAGSFPANGLPRGATVSVTRSYSLLFALLATASASGSWCGPGGDAHPGFGGCGRSRRGSVPNSTGPATR